MTPIYEEKNDEILAITASWRHHFDVKIKKGLRFSIWYTLEPTRHNHGQVFNCRCGRACVRIAVALITKTA
jgi:hypothetical protein